MLDLAELENRMLARFGRMNVVSTGFIIGAIAAAAGVVLHDRSLVHF
jgi:hypothetical protein